MTRLEAAEAKRARKAFRKGSTRYARHNVTVQGAADRQNIQQREAWIEAAVGGALVAKCRQSGSFAARAAMEMRMRLGAMDHRELKRLRRRAANSKGVQ